MRVEVFFSYSHPDEELRDQLEKHLAPLKREGVIAAWHDRKIVPGEPVDDTISRYLEVGDIILLLISADFIASEYCYGREMTRALERHDAGEAHVVPAILRHCDWQRLPFGRLLAAPRDGKPVTSWPDRDEALADVAKAVRRAAERLGARPVFAQPVEATSPRSLAGGGAGDRPRSSNLRVKKSFSDHDKDKFKADAFDHIARFFEASLEELARRNPDVQVDFRIVTQHRFEAAAYVHGERANEITVWFSRNDSWGGNIVYSHGRVEGSQTINGGFTVEDDGHALHLKADAFLTFGGRADREEHLTFNGAGDLLWEIFIEPLQR
jgi:hypothetical protein